MSANWILVVVVAFVGFGIIKLLLEIIRLLGRIERTGAVWSERWNDRYGPPEPRYPHS